MTANDSDVSDGETLTGSQVVRVYGQNLTAPFVTLTFGEVEYTPLTQGEGYIEFILGDNGTATINVDGNSFMSFEVEGIVVPTDIRLQKYMWMVDSNSASFNDPNRYNVKMVRANCINYNYKTNENSHFVLNLTFDEVVGEQSDFSFSNCRVVTRSPYQNTIGINMLVDDANLPSYVTYKGFIVAVFNYLPE